MRLNKTIALALAISAAVTASGCHRDAADEADHATATIPAPAPTSTIAPATATAVPFDQMDKNHDGSVTPDELDDSNPLKQHFPAADTNGDGKLSPDEVSKYNADASAKPDS